MRREPSRLQARWPHSSLNDRACPPALFLQLMEVRLSMFERAEALVSERREAPLDASDVGTQMLWCIFVPFVGPSDTRVGAARVPARRTKAACSPCRGCLIAMPRLLARRAAPLRCLRGIESAALSIRACIERLSDPLCGPPARSRSLCATRSASSRPIATSLLCLFWKICHDGIQCLTILPEYPVCVARVLD